MAKRIKEEVSGWMGARREGWIDGQMDGRID